MKHRLVRSCLAACAALLSCIAVSAPSAFAVADFQVVATLSLTFESNIVTSGNYAYVASDTNISIIDTNTNAVTATVSTASASDPRGALALGTKVYFASSGAGKLIILDTTSRTVSYMNTTGCTSPNMLIAYSSSRIAVNCHGNSSVQLIDVAGPTIAATLAVGTGPRGMSVGGDYLYVPNSGSNTVSVVNAAAATPTVVATVSVGSQPEYTTAYSGKVYVVNFNGNTVSIINAANNTVIATVAVGNNPQGIDSCQGNIFTANRWTGNSSVISPTTNAVTKTITIADVGAITHVISINGDYAYFLNSDRSSVGVVNCQTQTRVTTVSTTANPASIAFTNGYAYVTGSNVISVFTIPGSSTSIDPSQRPPDWMKQVARKSGDTCESGWNPSWAQWPNEGTGGFVCLQVMTWSDRVQGFVVQS